MSVRFTRRRVIVLSVLISLVAVIFFLRSAASTEWVDIGKGGPKRWEDFRYRLISFSDLKPTHPDLTRLTLDLQSGSARGAWVYLPISHCYAPKVRDGVPTVMCDSVHNSTIHLTGADNVREALLALSGKQVAAVQGKAIGLYADTPVIWVFDPTLKREEN